VFCRKIGYHFHYTGDKEESPVFTAKFAEILRMLKLVFAGLTPEIGN